MQTPDPWKTEEHLTCQGGEVGMIPSHSEQVSLSVRCLNVNRCTPGGAQAC